MLAEFTTTLAGPPTPWLPSSAELAGCGVQLSEHGCVDRLLRGPGLVHRSSHLALTPSPSALLSDLTIALGASKESSAQDKGAFHTPGALHQSVSSRHVLSGDRREET